MEIILIIMVSKKKEIMKTMIATLKIATKEIKIRSKYKSRV